MDLVDKESNRVWKNGKIKNAQKAEHLEKKYLLKEAVPEMHLGVCISDEKLDEIEEEMMKNSEKEIDKPTIYVGTTNLIENPANYDEIENPDKPANYAEIENENKVDKPDNYAENENKVDKPAIYAGIKGITKDQEEILMMAPNHRVYSRLNLESFETELEKAFIKANWEKIRENHSNEEHNKALETGYNKDDLKTFDKKKKVVNFQNLKATDLKNNKRIKIPEFDDDAEEIRSNTVKTELKEVFMKYMEEHCDEKGNLLDGNLTTEQVKAIKNLKMKMKNENLVCVETDKTGKFALDTKENYIAKLQKHIENDEVITSKEVRKLENKLNEHAEHIARITMAGENTGQTKRIKGNLKVKDNQIPILHGTSKDHKVAENDKMGPDVRPIMGAVVGPNVGLSNFIGREIIRRVADDADSDTVCKSTEELLSRFEVYNRDRVNNGYDKEKMILASMDIKKWYQSTLAKPSAKVIKKMIINSGLEFEGIDYDAISKYLAEHMTKEEIEEESFEEIIHRKNENVKKSKKSKKKNTKILETNDVTLVDDDGAPTAHKMDEIENQETFLKPIRNPTNLEKRNMLAKSVEIMIIATLENHIYKFGNEIRRQNEGGPIGLALTGEIADCYMINWDKRFLEILKSLNINPALYERFKDDITILIKSLEAGLKFENGSLVMDPEKKILDAKKSDEEITMEVMKDIAESEVLVNKLKQNKIEFEFYEKPTKNKKVILSNSAIPSNQKRTILTQECLRRLRNTQIELGEEIQAKHLNNFMLKMKNSGYTANYRKQVLDSAFKAFDKMVKDDQAGTKPLYRDKHWNKEMRMEQKQGRKLNWYKSGGNSENGSKLVEYKSVLFVPVTKGGKLAKELRNREEELNRYRNERIKIIEDGGVQLRNFLVQKDPFPKLKCDQKKCLVCGSEKSKNLKITCNSNNVGYRLECDTCLDRGQIRIYEGESSRSARIRGAEHLADLKNQRPKSVLLKHKLNEHKDEEMRIRMEITKKCKDPLTRQANEAIRIASRSKNPGELLNSKSEFNHPPLARVVVEKTKNRLQHQGKQT